MEELGHTEQDEETNIAILRILPLSFAPHTPISHIHTHNIQTHTLALVRCRWERSPGCSPPLRLPRQGLGSINDGGLLTSLRVFATMVTARPLATREQSGVVLVLKQRILLAICNNARQRFSIMHNKNAIHCQLHAS